MSTGVLDEDVGPGDQLKPDIDYDRPAGGGGELFDLVGDLSGKRILDVGCGLAPYRASLEQRGAVWVGLDLKGPGCSVIGDGDHLPFADGSIDGVLCAAVLEHLPEPDRLMAEIRRVLTSTGRFFGYVAFLEPFHGMSYFHMSHMGLEVLLVKHGFRPLRIFPSRIGTAYQIECLLFPKHVPVLQPVVGTLVQWSFEALFWLNRLVRRLVSGLQRRPAASERADQDQYRRLLALRFAVGFNFVAERSDALAPTSAGYNKLVK
jgi:ubiquinone/menaquinone biosynthesis C-methylase UbiE